MDIDPSHDVNHLRPGYHSSDARPETMVTHWTVVIQYLANNGPLSGQLWLPPLVIHTILYLLTIARVFFPRPLPGGGRHLMNRLLCEGTLLASAAFGTSLFDTIGALQRDQRVSLPAKQSEIMLAVLSVTMSRLMFNIRRLSTSLGTEPELLLSDMEMSRVQMRCTKGTREGELLVEVENVGPDEYELSRTNSPGEIVEELRAVTLADVVQEAETSGSFKMIKESELGYADAIATERRPRTRGISLSGSTLS